MHLSIPDIVKATKKLSILPEWSEGDYYSEFRVPVEIGGVTYEGLDFRGKAGGSNPNQQVMFQLDYKPIGFTVGPLCRFDWRPQYPHVNIMKGPPDLKGRRFGFYETHFHDFELNWLVKEKRMRRDNLPIARPVEKDPETFEELTIVVERLFNIEGITDIPRPLWQPKLL